MPKGDNNRKLTDEQRDQIIHLYITPNADGTWTGAKTIARTFGVTPNAIDNILAKAGVVKRSAKEASAHGKRCKPIKNLPDGAAPTCKCGCEQVVDWNRRKNHWNAYVVGHYRPKGKHCDPVWLRVEYLDKRRSTVDIAAECGIAPTNLSKWLKHFEIPLRSPSEARQGIQSGSNNPAWKGGITPERQRLYKSQMWKTLVAAVFRRDNYTCARCKRYRDKATPILHAHHIKSFAEYPELRFDAQNLVTLCDDCHLWVHSRANVSQLFIG